MHNIAAATALLALSLSSFVTAASDTSSSPTIAEADAEVPEIELRAPVPNFKVGWGQELQNHDQTNHWVVWVEGESACPAAVELAVLTRSPCGPSFSLKGQQRLSLGDCSSSNEPRSVIGSDGSKVLSCGKNGKDGRKIHCQYVLMILETNRSSFPVFVLAFRRAGSYVYRVFQVGDLYHKTRRIVLGAVFNHTGLMTNCIYLQRRPA